MGRKMGVDFLKKSWPLLAFMILVKHRFGGV